MSPNEEAAILVEYLALITFRIECAGENTIEIFKKHAKQGGFEPEQLNAILALIDAMRADY